MNRRKNGMKESYFGSVRFYRHLILTVVGLLIVVPVALIIYLSTENKKLEKRCYELYSNNIALQSQLDEAMLSQEVMRKLEPEPDSVKLSSTKYGEILVDLNSWELLLINDTHPLNRNFQVNLTEIAQGQSVDERIVKDLQEMLAAAQKAGFELHIYSAFRDMKKQQSLFNDCIKRLQSEGLDYHQAFYESKARIALPGTSEHQTGLVVDIAAKDYYYLDEGRGDLEEMKWLAENSYLYGFTLRYPKDKEFLTGIRYEPEHFRYVGKTVAKFLKKNNLVLEEFYNVLLEDGKSETEQ